MKNEKFFRKSGKSRSAWLGNFNKHKFLISEECHTEATQGTSSRKATNNDEAAGICIRFPSTRLTSQMRKRTDAFLHREVWPKKKNK